MIKSITINQLNCFLTVTDTYKSGLNFILDPYVIPVTLLHACTVQTGFGRVPKV